MKKVCTSCGLEREAEEDFRWEYKARGIRMTRCKYCQSELSKLHYKKNKQAYKDRSLLRKNQILIENKYRLYNYLSSHPCVDCGKTDIRIFEFDHVYGQKSGEISDLLRQGYNWSTIEIEMTKCEVRCANCHRIKTFQGAGSWRSTPDTSSVTRSYQQMHLYLITHPCVDCGEIDIRVLEFDHVRGQKTATISRLLAQGRNWSIIDAEIAKCEVRCANCHRIKTFERDGDWWKAHEIE
jgi:hypothetical protein